MNFHEIPFGVNCNQGQDEVPRGAIVTDYSDSVLVPSAIVNHTNEEIRKLGGEKVCMHVFKFKPVRLVEKKRANVEIQH